MLEELVKNALEWVSTRLSSQWHPYRVMPGTPRILEFVSIHLAPLL